MDTLRLSRLNGFYALILSQKAATPFRVQLWYGRGFFIGLPKGRPDRKKNKSGLDIVLL